MGRVWCGNSVNKLDGGGGQEKGQELRARSRGRYVKDFGFCSNSYSLSTNHKGVPKLFRVRYSDDTQINSHAVH